MFVGFVLFVYYWMVYFSLLLCGVIVWFLFKMCVGLMLCVIGELLELVYVFGYLVCIICFGVLLFGGVCCGLVGVYLLFVYMLMWVENMVVGCGWIVFVLIIFVIWCFMCIMFGVLLFGGVMIL